MRARNDRRTGSDEDKAFFKKASVFFGFSVGLGVLAVCCALVAPLFFAGAAAAVFGFLRSPAAAVLAAGLLGVAAILLVRHRSRAGCATSLSESSVENSVSNERAKEEEEAAVGSSK